MMRWAHENPGYAFILALVLVACAAFWGVVVAT